MVTKDFPQARLSQHLIFRVQNGPRISRRYLAKPVLPDCQFALTRLLAPFSTFHAQFLAPFSTFHAQFLAPFSTFHTQDAV